jgi:hypothetical protein
MGHHIAWDNADKTVILHQYIAPASKEDLYQLAQKSAEMLGTVPHTVHLIIDERVIKLILNASDFRFLETLVPPNQGSVVMVVPRIDTDYKKITQRLGHIVAPKSVNESHFASSIEEARSLLQTKVSVNYP